MAVISNLIFVISGFNLLSLHPVFHVCIKKSHVSHLITNMELLNSLHNNGKIYVVVAVVAVIFIGLIGYLISIDRKVSRLEKERSKTAK